MKYIIDRYIVDSAEDQVNISHGAKQSAIQGDITPAYKEVKLLIQLNAFAPKFGVQVHL